MKKMIASILVFTMLLSTACNAKKTDRHIYYVRKLDDDLMVIIDVVDYEKRSSDFYEGLFE